MGTIFLIASASVSLFLLALLIGILGNKRKVMKTICVIFYIGATLLIAGYAFNFLLQYNAALTPMLRLLMSLAGFGLAVALSLLIKFQASILADATKEKLKEHLKSKVENISLPSVNISQTTGKFVRMAYSLFL